MTPEQRYNKIVALVREARQHGLASIDLASLEAIIYQRSPTRRDLSK